eukprot:PhM_4_TR3208/c0_g1_i1/m.49447/K10395/KIF4_21_27; kinesin family member 4/21/27
MPQRVQVVVRCRPKLPHEITPNGPNGQQEPIIDFDEAGSTVRVRDKQFGFDKVVPPYWNQVDVYDRVVSPLIDRVLEGLHCTVFAYGQTGSGKTHTMEGFRYVHGGGANVKPNIAETPEEQLGVIPRVVRTLFDTVEARMASSDTAPRYKVKCSYLQIYNEKVIDLLNPASSALTLMNAAGSKGRGPGSGAPTSGLRVRWAKTDQFYVENLFIFECDTAEQVMELFQLGVKNKCMASHHMNMQSSRSHCLFTLYVTQWDPLNAPTADAATDVIRSEFTLVDLAGSEKLALLSKNPSQQLLQESIDINASLLALGKVITALAEASESQTNVHVPYRDSKLTRLLKHALGGNSVTVMVACINPCDAYVEETLSTLYYAGRARNITNEPRVNEDSKSALIKALRAEIESLKLELQHYKNLLSDGVPMSSNMLPTSASASSTNQTARHPNADAQRGAVTAEPDGVVAEKLLQSVNMIRDLVTVNSNLRTAFDKVAEMKRQADNQVTTLNIENSTLRERVEMLESIVVSTESDTAPAPSTPPQERVSRPPVAVNRSSSNVHDVRRSHSQSRDGGLTGSGSRPSRGTTGVQQQQHAQLKQRLQVYNSKYRNPRALGNYNSKIRQQAPQQTATSIPDFSSHLVPPSLAAALSGVSGGQQQQQQQGARVPLSFGGTPGEVEAMEQRRRDRQQRAAMLEQQHRMLQAGGAGAMVMQTSSSYYPPSAGSMSSSGYPTPPSQPRTLGPVGGQQMQLAAPQQQQQQQPQVQGFTYQESLQHFTPEQLALLAARRSQK